MDRTRARVLFLCTGNSARSQMAEGLLREQAPDRFEVLSAGLDPKSVNPLAVRAMAEIGIDISGQRSKSLSEYMGRMHFSFVITLCSNAERSCPAVFPGMGTRLHWDLEDPSAATGTDGEKFEAFRRVRDEIARRIVGFISEGTGPGGAGLL
jgi:arsenate reductase (thioredoxin)